MSRAFRYLARELAKSYAAASALAMLVMFDLLAFLAEAQDIGDAHYTVLDALLVVLYSTPALLVDLSPFIALLATLNAYDRLNATSELIALRGAGVSGMRLGRVAGYVAAAFMLVIAAVEVDRTAAASRSEPAAHARDGARRQSAARQRLLDSHRHDVRQRRRRSQDAGGPSGIRVFTFADDAHLQTYLRATSAEIVNADRLATAERLAQAVMPPTARPTRRRRRLPTHALAADLGSQHQAVRPSGCELHACRELQHARRRTAPTNPIGAQAEQIGTLAPHHPAAGVDRVRAARRAFCDALAHPRRQVRAPRDRRGAWRS